MFSRLAGYEDVNDADRLCRDSVMRQLVGGRAVKHGAASASALGRFKTEMLTEQVNLAALIDLPGRWIDAVHGRRPPKSITLDMDSSESPVHGDQEGSAWNGHFKSKCLHPLFVFNQYGDLERCALRPGNVHSADGWEDVLKPALFDLLEAEGWDYAICIKSNSKLHERISWLTRRRPGRPSHGILRHYTSFHYRAQSWSKPRRIVAKIEFHPGALFPTIGFIVTNRSLPNERVLAFYNGRGTAEQPIKEGKFALKWTRLSCMRFAANAVRLQRHALAYNLAARAADQDRSAAGVPRPLRRLPDGRDHSAAAGLRWYPHVDRRPAPTTFRNGTRMTGSPRRSAALNAGDGRGVSGKRHNHALRCPEGRLARYPCSTQGIGLTACV